MRLKVEDIKKCIDALNRGSAKPDIFYMFEDDLAAILKSAFKEMDDSFKKVRCFETRTGLSVKKTGRKNDKRII